LALLKVTWVELVTGLLGKKTKKSLAKDLRRRAPKSPQVKCLTWKGKRRNFKIKSLAK
jgi:hypothetical protein